jgi:hypothetical protein
MRDESLVVSAAVLFVMFAGAPLLLISSVILVFTNPFRAALGFGALLCSVFAFLHSSKAFL